ncbi:MAG TPA: peptidylprolyl isomerase [Terriglobales bacterium]|nr:peptidylprolyl isomerase [Terriglobales bacterium]
MKCIFNGVVCLLLLTGVMLSQTASPGPTLKTRQSDPNELVPNSIVSPEAPVITVQGLCEKPANSNATPSDCSTVITRAEFEKIVDAVQPNMAPAQKKQFANQYVMALLLAEKAHEMGLDQGPEFNERLQLTRLQLLDREAAQQLQKDAQNVPESAISDYYQQHAAEYKTISFERIYVPRQKQIETTGNEKPNDPEVQKKREASEAEMKAEADKLRARAAAGEDFLKLQQEAYDVAGSKMKASNVKMENLPKNSIPNTDASIFDSKKGEVSQVFSDPTGYRIYKVLEITDQPLAKVHDQIAQTLRTENIKKSFDSLQNSAKTTYDEAYFGTPAPPSLRNPGAQGTTSPSTTPGKK